MDKGYCTGLEIIRQTWLYLRVSASEGLNASRGTHGRPLAVFGQANRQLLEAVVERR